jgi:hypothetical protein
MVVGKECLVRVRVHREFLRRITCRLWNPATESVYEPSINAVSSLQPHRRMEHIRRVLRRGCYRPPSASRPPAKRVRNNCYGINAAASRHRHRQYNSSRSISAFFRDSTHQITRFRAFVPSIIRFETDSTDLFNIVAISSRDHLKSDMRVPQRHAARLGVVLGHLQAER